MSSRNAEKQQKRNFSDISDTESDLEDNDRLNNNKKKLLKVKNIKKQEDKGTTRTTRKTLTDVATTKDADSDSDIGGSITGENTANINNKDVPEEAEKLKIDDKKTKAKYLKPFTDEMLIGPEGLLRIYQEFPKAATFQGRGSEAKYIKRLMTLYKEWAFQLHPGVAFNDVLAKCESLGSKARTRNYLTKLRDDERNRYLRDVYGFKESEPAPILDSATLMSAATTTGGSSSFEAEATDAAVVPSAVASASESGGLGNDDDDAIVSKTNSDGDAVPSSTHDEDTAPAPGEEPMQAEVVDVPVPDDIEEESPNFLLEITMG